MRRHSRRLVVLATLTALLIALAWWARQKLGITLDPGSLRTFVQGLGTPAPVVLFLLIAFRGLLGIPSQLALIVAGLCFGTLFGTIYGAFGLTASGLGSFLLARHGARDVLEARMTDRLGAIFANSGDRRGAAFIAVGTAYPIGFITAYHALAGLTPMRLALFLPALALGSIVRSGIYTYFGSSLLDQDVESLLRATLVITACLLLPLLLPRSRAWLRSAIAPNVRSERDAGE